MCNSKKNIALLISNIQENKCSSPSLNDCRCFIYIAINVNLYTVFSLFLILYSSYSTASMPNAFNKQVMGIHAVVWLHILMRDHRIVLVAFVGIFLLSQLMLLIIQFSGCIHAKCGMNVIQMQFAKKPVMIRKLFWHLDDETVNLYNII